MKNTIESIRVESVVDNDPDTSQLGRFTDDQSPEAFIRYGEHEGKQIKELREGDELPHKSRHYRFFLPAMTAEESGSPSSPREDWKRMEALSEGEWHYIGIIAKAVIRTGSGTMQTIRSGGLWGMESDADEDWLNEAAIEQVEELRKELKSLGFGSRAITYALRKIETKI